MLSDEVRSAIETCIGRIKAVRTFYCESNVPPELLDACDAVMRIVTTVMPAELERVDWDHVQDPRGEYLRIVRRLRDQTLRDAYEAVGPGGSQAVKKVWNSIIYCFGHNVPLFHIYWRQV